MIHVIFSGGLDSTVALTQAKHSGEQVQALFFEYGQRHGGEAQAAQLIAAKLDVDIKTIFAEGLLHSQALLADSSEPIPTEDYASQNITVTEVLGRNLLFASVAVAGASRGDSIVLGVHGGDHDLYPDCRPDFWAHIKALGEAYSVKIKTPFINISKADIVALGARIGAPMHLSWSCYDGGKIQCGKCATCRERREAFVLAGVDDFTEYVG